MKLKKITINGLFKTFKHTITFNEKEGITIVIGENGLGKTVILEMIEAFFNNKFDYLSLIEFETIEMEFTDNIEWEISLDKTEEISESKRLRRRIYYPLTLIESSPKRKSIRTAKLQNDDTDKYQRNVRFSRSNMPFLEKIGYDRWLDQRYGEILDTETVRNLYGDNYPSLFIEETNDIPEWVVKRIQSNKVYLIKTQRLLLLEDRDKNNLTKTVDKYSNELSRTIQSHLARSTAFSSELDRTYPNRLLDRLSKRKNKNQIISEDLIASLNRLTEKRFLLNKVGLIAFEENDNIFNIENFSSEDVRNVLQLYVEDSFKKLEVYDELAKKLEIFVNIVNKRFKHKKLTIDKERGFVFESTIQKASNPKDDITIQAGKLSSGEQNELVLFYELLFKTEQNTLVLIDEPEISLHISWQNSFIDDLKEIIKLNKFDILIATHSPNIIGNNWDLRVELKGLE